MLVMEKRIEEDEELEVSPYDILLSWSIILHWLAIYVEINFNWSFQVLHQQKALIEQFL